MKLVVLLAFLLFTTTAFAKCLIIKDDGSVKIPVLSGYLISEQEWELPQMKTQFTAWLLKLDSPITLCNPTFANQQKTVDCVQLLVPNNASLKQYQWQHLAVQGSANTFFENASVESVTPIAIEAEQFWVGPQSKPTLKNFAALKSYRCQSTAWAEQRVGGS